MDRGYDHVFITPNRIIERRLTKKTSLRREYLCMHYDFSSTAIARASIAFDIPFVMFAEGESEYGGSKNLKTSTIMILKMV